LGLAGSVHFFLTVFFDALNEGEDPSPSRFNVGGKGHWIEAAAGVSYFLRTLRPILCFSMSFITGMK
jgi:hypothetical protein